MLKSSQCLYEITWDNNKENKNIQIRDLENVENLKEYNSQYNEVDDMEQISDSLEELNILCIIYKNHKIGASYYSCREGNLYLYEQMYDHPPYFMLTESIYYELKPHYIVTSGSRNCEFIKFLINLVNSSEDSTFAEDNTITPLPKNFILLSMKDYNYEDAKRIIYSINLQSYQDEINENKKEIYINSLVNFEHRLAVFALGALIRYTEKNWTFFGKDGQDMQFMHIYQLSLQHRILLDKNSLKALQLFNTKSHDAFSKRGTQDSNREGISLFSIYSTYCKTQIGKYALKNMLTNPINDIGIINKRLDFISFAMKLNNQDFIDVLNEHLKHVVDINKFLLKIHNMRATHGQWCSFYKTISHIIQINELCASYRKTIGLFEDLNATISVDLSDLAQTIANALDLQDQTKSGPPAVRAGLDRELDAKKLKKADIGNLIKAAVPVVVENTPDFIKTCGIIWLPETGYLISIKEWESNCDPTILEQYGFQLIFTVRGILHCKNTFCLEMDRNIGNIYKEILDHEIRIISRLAGFVLKYNKHIRNPLQIIGELDGLISVAKISAERNYKRPILNNGNIHTIRDCRHPLMEVCQSGNFESNCFYSGGNHSRVKILTGPNGSGKSVYLKQILIVIYLAHIGVYVPASEANIGLVYSIHTQMQATESSAIHMSAFMIDVSQVTKALKVSTPSSLILLDEFGRGTSYREGFSLFCGFLKGYLENANECPHILVSTHYQHIERYLPESPLVEFLKMSYTMINERVIYLYKIARGVSKSLTFEIAKKTFETDDIERDLVKRANDIFNELANTGTISPDLNIYNNYFDSHANEIDLITDTYSSDET